MPPTLFGEGTANFAGEKLDLRLVSKPKGKSLISLRGPIVVGGTFGQPAVRPDVKQISARGVAATALAVVATPLAAVIPFIQVGGGKDQECGQLVQTARHAIEQPQPAVAMAKR